MPNLGLSLDAIGLLKAVAKSKNGMLHILGEDQFVVDDFLYAPATPKFFHDDLDSLVALDLFAVAYSPRGEPYYRITRKGNRVFKILPAPDENSDEPIYAKPGE